MLNETMIIALITINAQLAGVDPDTAIAVAKVESGLKPSAVSHTRDYGLFQLNAKSFPKYTKAELLNPYTNIRLGTEYLAKLRKECSGLKKDGWLACYNVGSHKAKSFKYPELHSYVKKVRSARKTNKKHIDFYH